MCSHVTGFTRTDEFVGTLLCGGAAKNAAALALISTFVTAQNLVVYVCSTGGVQQRCYRMPDTKIEMLHVGDGDIRGRSKEGRCTIGFRRSVSKSLHIMTDL